jgi:hypothetical protein
MLFALSIPVIKLVTALSIVGDWLEDISESYLKGIESRAKQKIRLLFSGNSKDTIPD